MSIDVVEVVLWLESSVSGGSGAFLMFLILQQPQPYTVFPYTTLFRSATSSPRGQHREPIVVLVSFDGWRSDTRTTIGSDRKSTRLNSSHANSSYTDFCSKKECKLA